MMCASVRVSLCVRVDASRKKQPKHRLTCSHSLIIEKCHDQLCASVIPPPLSFFLLFLLHLLLCLNVIRMSLSLPQISLLVAGRNALKR